MSRWLPVKWEEKAQDQGWVHKDLLKGWAGAILKLQQHLAPGQKARGLATAQPAFAQCTSRKGQNLQLSVIKQLSVEVVPCVRVPEGIVRGRRWEGGIQNEKAHLKRNISWQVKRGIHFNNNLSVHICSSSLFCLNAKSIRLLLFLNTIHRTPHIHWTNRFKCGNLSKSNSALMALVLNTTACLNFKSYAI